MSEINALQDNLLEMWCWVGWGKAGLAKIVNLIVCVEFYQQPLPLSGWTVGQGKVIK